MGQKEDEVQGNDWDVYISPKAEITTNNVDVIKEEQEEEFSEENDDRKVNRISPQTVDFIISADPSKLKRFGGSLTYPQYHTLNRLTSEKFK